MPSGFLFDVWGEDDEGQPIASYHLAVNASGGIDRYDDTESQWTAISAQGVVKVGSWVTLRVEASLQTARVFLDGQPVGMSPLSTEGATRLTAHAFSSAGKAPEGSEFWIDDVRFVDE